MCIFDYVQKMMILVRNKGVARKKLRGGPNFATFNVTSCHLFITAYSRKIYENINFIEFLPSCKLAAKLCKNSNAFSEKAN